MPVGRPKGLPKTGGRRKGAVNKVTADLKTAAQEYTAEALRTFASIMRNSESDAARVAAADKLLDRGHGRASQPIEHGGKIDLAMIMDTVMAEMGDRVERMRHPDETADATRH